MQALPMEMYLPLLENEYIPPSLDEGGVYYFSTKRVNPNMESWYDFIVGIGCCPRCSSLTYVTELQNAGLKSVVCTSRTCPSVYTLKHVREDGMDTHSWKPRRFM